MASLRDTFVPNVPLEQTSALFLMRELANIQREIALEPLPGDRIAGGSDVLPKTLAEKLGKRVIYNAQVQRIDQTGSVVRVLFSRNDRIASFGRNDSVETISAGRVVSTLPSTVLRDIKFYPDVSAGKRRALEELRLASVTRIWVGTSKRVWEEKNEAGDVENDGAMGKIRFEAAQQDGEGAMLGVYTTGAEARRLAKRNELERIAELMTLAERAHPGFEKFFTIGTSKCWDEDPLQKGAYAEFSPGQITTLVPELARVEGRVHFAGDQLSHRPGFMHGALASARRVVKEIVERDK
jgi:monoamine oxidase